MRGQVYEIGSKKIFTMGGAYSIDRYMRTQGLSYWERELPDNDEYREATKNPAEHSNSVDIIITHTAPREIIRRMGKFPDPHDMEQTGFLEWIMYNVSFSHWYFGHWHTDKTYCDRFTATYYKLHEIG